MRTLLRLLRIKPSWSRQIVGQTSRHRGDPEGLRIARRRHAALAEAGRVVRALQTTLRGTGVAADEAAALAKRIANAERDELMRLHGRVEPRKRFKTGAGQPLHQGRPVEILATDESGRSVPQPGIENAVFALGGVAIAPPAIDDYVMRANDLKQRAFGTEKVTFHEPFMRRREDIFYFGGNEREQQEFDRELDRLISQSEFSVFGVAIRKDAYERDFLETGVDKYLPTDVYSIAIQVLLERYVDYLAYSPSRPLGSVVLESIGPKEDALHQRDFVDLLLFGTQWVPPSAFQGNLETGVRYVRKQGSAPTELADMWARDLFEWTRGGCVGTPGRWRLFESRIYGRGDLMMGKFGLKVFPDSDIREQIEAHRRDVIARRAN